MLLMVLLLRGMTRMGMHSRMVRVRVRMGMVLGRWHMLRRRLLLLVRCHRRMLMVVLQLLLLLLMLKLLLLKLLLVLFGECRIGQLFPGGGAGKDRFLIGRADVVHGA